MAAPVLVDAVWSAVGGEVGNSDHTAGRGYAEDAFSSCWETHRLPSGPVISSCALPSRGRGIRYSCTVPTGGAVRPVGAAVAPGTPGANIRTAMPSAAVRAGTRRPLGNCSTRCMANSFIAAGECPRSVGEGIEATDTRPLRSRGHPTELHRNRRNVCLWSRLTQCVKDHPGSDVTALRAGAVPQDHQQQHTGAARLISQRAASEARPATPARYPSVTGEGRYEVIGRTGYFNGALRPGLHTIGALQLGSAAVEVDEHPVGSELLSPIQDARHGWA